MQSLPGGQSSPWKSKPFGPWLVWSLRLLSALMFHSSTIFFPFYCLLLPTQSPHCGQQHFKHFLQMHLEHFKPLKCPFTSQSSIKNPTHPTKLKWAPLSRETFASNPSWKWSCPPLLNPHDSFSFNYKNILRTNSIPPLWPFRLLSLMIFVDISALSYTINSCNFKTDNLCSNSSSS